MATPAPVRASPASRYSAGDVIAEKYRLGRKLGEGGMGEVWLSHNETLDIDVAIKLIRGEAATTETSDRLLREARAAARLEHPAIVRVNDFGKTRGGSPFIVMELLDGEDLATALGKRGRLTPEKALRTLLPIAHALTLAHTKSVVHRDVKPENVFLAKSADGHIQPKLVDFGVAKHEKQQSHRITQSGTLLGSPLYMSPEQARGDDVDHRADIWAFGVVLYESLTGKAPFDGKNFNAVLFSILSNHPTPLTDLGIGDADLWALIDRALQKDPDRRWYSMRDFGEALAHWLEDHGVHDDITGASLQTTWIQRKKEDPADALGDEEATPTTNDALGALPPVPVIAAPGEERVRVITVRTQRPRKPGMLWIGAGVVTLVLVALGLAISFGSSDRSTAHSDSARATEPSAAATAAPLDPPVKDDPAHEHAIEEALAAENAAPAASGSAPVHGEPRPHAAPAAAAAARPPAAAPPGIHKADPYRPIQRAPSALKNPF